jgi:peptidoglycan/LPS O-acetylase OafA/YrhL
MRNYKCALPALLLGAAGACCGAVPVIHLAPSAAERVQHGGGAAQQQFVAGALLFADGQRRQSAGSFAFYASAAFPVLAAAGTPAPGARVAATAQPSRAALLLLALGCLIHLGRRRRHGFALRPASTLRERIDHAPGHA